MGQASAERLSVGVLAKATDDPTAARAECAVLLDILGLRPDLDQ